MAVALSAAVRNAGFVFHGDSTTRNMQGPLQELLRFAAAPDVAVASRYYADKVVEVVRDTSDVAFELDIYNDVTCEADSCDVEEGWLMYSVERFYTKPLVYGLACAAGDDDGAYTLTATTMDTHKMA